MPAFIHINFRDDVPDRYMPSEELADEGFAVLSFCYSDVASDDGDFSSLLPGLLYPGGKRGPHDSGKIGLWAWAASRVMDYAVTLPELDKNRISVIGHSRLGKTALLAGALDERFYCAFSNDSGCSGAALAHGYHENAETIGRIFRVFPYWFTPGYAKYAENEGAMPFDQHFLLAANAPHRVYVADAEEDLWADPKNEYASCIAASAYYEKKGLPGFVHPDRYPKPGEVFHEGYIGYHIRPGRHYLSREDWLKDIAYLRKQFAGKA